ncbi:dihydrofolate reductase, partial [Neoconidiobolus thromboides FSU 785]
SLITAVTKERGIGYQGDLPWIKTPIRTDMMFYEKVTRHLNVNQDKPFETSEINDTVNNVVIMGRVSWECVPIKYRPFRNRINIIVSRNKDLNLEMSDEKLKQYTHIVHSLEDGLILAKKLTKNGSVFVIGGSQLYTQAIQHPKCTKWFITELFDHPELLCDTFFPE